jgi:hypothetical protein
MPEGFDDAAWLLLRQRIEDRECTPFLGAGASYPTLPLGGRVAQDWAEEFNYPLEQTSNLARVAQYLAVTVDPMFPKKRIAKQFLGVGPPDFARGEEPHALLSQLGLPLYITTNYDSFMFQALCARGKRPQQDVCRWNRIIRDELAHEPSPLAPENVSAVSPEAPVVFHLHGHWSRPSSIVLTEDDYLDFLVNVADDPGLIPERVQEAITSTSLLFVGYSMEDWNFRVLFRTLSRFLERSVSRAHVSVQLAPGKTPAQQDKARAYLSRYFQDQKIRVYWGEATRFALELRDRLGLQGGADGG